MPFSLIVIGLPNRSLELPAVTRIQPSLTRRIAVRATPPTTSTRQSKPGRVPGVDGALQAPHVDVSVFARGMLQRVVTRIYFADEDNSADPVLASVPSEARETLLATPTDDDAFGPGRVREDGRKLHPAYLLQVKTPEESRGPWDYYKLLQTTPAEEAFRPPNEGGCSLVRS